MKLQRTIKESFSIEGKGLQSGLLMQVIFNPAPENYGYKIKRTDIINQPIIDAVTDNVTCMNHELILSENGAQVSGVEHALAALYGCEIDNCLLEINGPEFPAMDGSSIAYVSKIKEVGTHQQTASRKIISLKRKRIRITDPERSSEMLLLPADSLNIQTTIKFESFFVKQQSACMDHSSVFARDIASARSFIFVKELKPLIQGNLIKGGDLDNTIVIYDEHLPQEEYDRLALLAGIKTKRANHLGYIMNKPLIYENELAKHKLLDILGNIALIGGFIEGTIIAKCPGHKVNILFAKAIRECYLERNRKEAKHINTIIDKKTN